jgi:uncharacterized coiled-coil protein SlyX
MLSVRPVLLTAGLLLLASCNYDARLAGIESNQAGLEKRLDEIESTVDRANGDLASLQQQITATNNEVSLTAALLKQTRNEVSGVGSRSVTIPGTGEFRTVFGNSSGHNALVYVTNVGLPGSTGLEIFVRRIKKPVSTHNDSPPSAVPPTSLPPEFETTEKLELDAPGGTRTLPVPCGFELLAGNAAAPAQVDVLIYYREAPCQ